MVCVEFEGIVLHIFSMWHLCDIGLTTIRGKCKGHAATYRFAITSEHLQVLTSVSRK